jgi:hypothetical protein
MARLTAGGQLQPKRECAVDAAILTSTARNGECLEQSKSRLRYHRFLRRAEAPQPAVSNGLLGPARLLYSHTLRHYTSRAGHALAT